MISRLIINEPPLQVLPTLAVAIGLNEAIFVQQLHYWLANPRIGVTDEADNTRWVRNTYTQWQRDNFPFWSVGTVRRIVDKLEENGIVLSRSDINKESRDRTKWYSIDYLALLSQVPSAQNEQMQLLNMSKALPENTSSNNTNVLLRDSGESDQSDNVDRQRKKRATIPKPILTLLENHFRSLTGLPTPKKETLTMRKEYGAAWVAPLREMFLYADSDADATVALITQTVTDMQADGLTIACPRSIRRVFISNLAKQKATPKEIVVSAW
jgi:hypothetical protein